LEILPANGLAFEDSANGVLAAKNAGLFCYAVPNSTTEEWISVKRTAIIPSFIDLDPTNLIKPQ
jgi:beta-phosphoglucomutase-like phosphatase (HAD superfamily)